MSFSKESFSKFFKEVSSKDINKRNEEGETISSRNLQLQNSEVINKKRGRGKCKR